MNKKAQLGRIFFAFILVAFGIAVFFTFFWETLNQRLFIPMAKWLRFKKDDTKKVEKEVTKILGEEDAKKTKGKKKNVSK
jgi:hypothetical protein